MAPIACPSMTPATMRHAGACARLRGTFGRGGPGTSPHRHAKGGELFIHLGRGAMRTFHALLIGGVLYQKLKTMIARSAGVFEYRHNKMLIKSPEQNKGEQIMMPLFRGGIEISGRPGSNRRRPAWEAGILPLNYARKAIWRCAPCAIPLAPPAYRSSSWT